MNASVDSRRSSLKIGLSRRLRYFVKACTNFHKKGPLPDIFLFATPRSGSTWLMEIIASQPRFKYYDEPLSPRRENVRFAGVIDNYASLMPDCAESDRIISFLRGLQAGRYAYMNPPPFRRNHRLFTNRIVFKIHEIEHLMQRVVAECEGQLIYLLRHPIATSISRTVQPRLELFLRSKYYENLVGDSKRFAEIRHIAAAGSALQRAVISWCFENLVALCRPGDDWLIVTYEELVLNPSQSCDLLMTRLQLSERETLLASFERPAVNIRMSRAETIKAMQVLDASARRSELVAKWQAHISEAQYKQAADVTELFKLDAYDVRKPLATTPYLHFHNTPTKLGDTKPYASLR